jgi:hypothetical protein
MQTAEVGTFSAFLAENANHLLGLCLLEGFAFSVKESSRCVTVRCVLPSGYVRFVVFDDHRIESPHGGKPHVCNQWHKAVGDPISFTMGEDLTDASRLQSVLRATAVMCLTQTDAYGSMKADIFCGNS